MNLLRQDGESETIAHCVRDRLENRPRSEKLFRPNISLYDLDNLEWAPLDLEESLSCLGRTHEVPVGPLGSEMCNRMNHA